MLSQARGSSINSFDFEKQIKRWYRVATIVNEADPDVGSTPRTLIWKKNKTSLWHYPSTIKKKYRVPILVVYSLFNKPFILDLAPGSSMIAGLMEKGYDVYLLDWGIPEKEDSHLAFDHYVFDYLQKGVKRVLRHSGAEHISLLGYCLGGTIAAMYTAIADEPIKNLMVAATPVDFSIGGLPSSWQQAIENGELNLDHYIDVHGNIPAHVIESMFRMVTSPVYYSPYVNLYDRAWNEQYVDKWRRINKWQREPIPLAGETFRQLMKEFMKENKLVKGELILRGKRVDLSNIHANLFVVSSKNDHLVQEKQALPLLKLVSSKDKTHICASAGHISLAIMKEFTDMLDEWFKERS
ncbi:alpha/beta fold hydrolase [bacterium LRH843]|nr:alpha/beta fold hydrolase [bacterium LRH843]